MIKKQNKNESEEILYIIGNGFDLNLGLKTSYKDYFIYRNDNELKNIIKEIIDLSLKENKFTKYKFNIEKIHGLKDNLQEMYELIEEKCDRLSINSKEVYPEKYMKYEKIKQEIGEYVNKYYYSNYFDNKLGDSETDKKILNTSKEAKLVWFDRLKSYIEFLKSKEIENKEKYQIEKAKEDIISLVNNKIYENMQKGYFKKDIINLYDFSSRNMYRLFLLLNDNFENNWNSVEEKITNYIRQLINIFSFENYNELLFKIKDIEWIDKFFKEDFMNIIIEQQKSKKNTKDKIKEIRRRCYRELWKLELESNKAVKYNYRLEYKLYKKIIDLFEEKIEIFLKNSNLKYEFEKNYKKYKEYLIELFQLIDYINFCIQIKMIEPYIKVEGFKDLKIFFEKEKIIDLFEEFKNFEKEYRDYFIEINNSILGILNLNINVMKENKFFDSNFIIKIDDENSKKEIIKILKNKIEEKINKIINPKEEFYVMSFNYTTYLQDYFKYKVININNSIHDDEIIFGIDKIQLEKIENKEGFNFFIKNNRRKEKEQEWKSFIESHNFRKIYFYGHSLADADYTFFEDLFNILLEKVKDKKLMEIELIFLYSNGYEESCKKAAENLIEKYCMREKLSEKEKKHFKINYIKV